MTASMAADGTWLCPTELDRTRLLDMEARIARPRALMYAALVVGLGSAIPWVGWWPMVPVTLQLAIYAVLSPLITRSERPEYVVATTVVSAQVLLGVGIALSGGPRSPGIALMLLPLVTLLLAEPPGGHAQALERGRRRGLVDARLEGVARHLPLAGGQRGAPGVEVRSGVRARDRVFEHRGQDTPVCRVSPRAARRSTASPRETGGGGGRDARSTRAGGCAT